MVFRASPQHSNATSNQTAETFQTCNEDELEVSSVLQRFHVRISLLLP